MQMNLRDVHFSDCDGVVRAEWKGRVWHLPTRNPSLFAWALNFHSREIRFESKNLLSPGDVVIDVGSCTGEYTTYAAEKVGPSGSVYAFEPDPLYRRCLRKNLAHYGFDGFTEVAGVAVSNVAAPALTLFSIPNSMGGGSLEDWYGRDFPAHLPFSVPVTTLDAYFAGRMPERVAMLEVTVNGHEPEVFFGAEQLVERTENVILQSSRDAECEAWLTERGFTRQGLIDLNPLGSKQTYGRILWLKRTG